VIVSASRRTDIPAFYSEWFFKRLEEGFVIVRNPFNFQQVIKVPLTKDWVDGFVFWTKNPEQMMKRLHLLEGYPYYFLFTLNPYDKNIEKRLPEKERLIGVFQKLSEAIGKERVIWRYDPIILTPELNVGYHIESFRRLSLRLSGFTDKCIISFVAFYPKVEKRLKEMNAHPATLDEKKEIASAFSEIGKKQGIKVEVCAEEADLSSYGVFPAKCIDKSLLERISGKEIDAKKDKNQRKFCGCDESVDIGSYNTCLHECIYCYANSSMELVKKNVRNYDVNSPLLCSQLTGQEIVREKVKS
jgi:DNA repair photolyase